jgi:hypothetical protein
MATTRRRLVLDDPSGEPFVLSLHLSEADMRAVAAGRMPKWMPREAQKALVWFDEGIAAGIASWRSKK